jgi:hypothetical protein
MYLLAMVIIYLLLAKRFIDWSRWKEFYPTIQFFIICNLLYNFLFYHHNLWIYKSITLPWLNHTLIELVFTFFIIPITLYIYLQYYPKGIKKYLYIGAWVAYFTLMEFLSRRLGLFVHDNGWHIGWSALFNICAFIILRLHYKNYIRAFFASAIFIIILLFFFHPRLQEMK